MASQRPVCGCTSCGEFSLTSSARSTQSDPTGPRTLNENPLVHWYQCNTCGRFWIKILFEGHHPGCSTFYAVHVEKDAIDTFDMDQIDEIFLASDRTFVGGYDRGDRTTVYTGGFPIDPWYGFRHDKRLLKAKEFAVKAHGEQMYGDKPYLVHLEHVHEVMKRYRSTNLDVLLQMTGWLHDILEDTAVSKAELTRSFGEEVADIVYRVTDEPGNDRAERKRKTYGKIRRHIDATTVKLCDRIANVEASSDVPEKLEMYRNEYGGFRDALYVRRHGSLRDLWRHLDQMLGCEYKSMEERFLPEELLSKASVSPEGEHAWKMEDVPKVIETARASGLANQGGQPQFQGAIGTAELYWLNFEPPERSTNESWLQYVDRAAKETLEAFGRLCKDTDFEKEGRKTWKPFQEIKGQGINVDEHLRFALYFEGNYFEGNS